MSITCYSDMIFLSKLDGIGKRQLSFILYVMVHLIHFVIKDRIVLSLPNNHFPQIACSPHLLSLGPIRDHAGWLWVGSEIIRILCQTTNPTYWLVLEHGPSVAFVVLASSLGMLYFLYFLEFKVLQLQ